ADGWLGNPTFTRLRENEPMSVPSELHEALKEFLVESRDNLDELDRDLVTLEKDPRNREGLASIFRKVHTIKGTCGFFDLVKLGEVAHAGENLLGRLRDGQ